MRGMPLTLHLKSPTANSVTKMVTGRSKGQGGGEKTVESKNQCVLE